MKYVSLLFPFTLFTFILLIAGCTTTRSGTMTQPETSQPSQEIVTYSLSQIAQHNTESDCWLVIHGKVYDVTSFIPAHPGGRAILQGCGTDATNLFETRPMGSGTPHSNFARTTLENYYVGDLK